MTALERDSRLSGRRKEDPRSPFERDRDRILHCSAFRRLAGVTQVVDPAEGQVFHNRLTHSLKVAQIARRLAERLLREQPEECEALGGLSPDVVETAALAHDLGHPPFGHVAEAKLHKLVVANKGEGFEGNAQSFRIVTKLALKKPAKFGLDLTLASLNAILKYPWLRDPQGPKKKKAKWGAYETEHAAFDAAQEIAPNPGTRTLEAEVMNISDDIAYAVHDLEDFFRAGLIPLEILWSEEISTAPEGEEGENRLVTGERLRFLEKALLHWRQRDEKVDPEECSRVLEDLMGILPPMSGRYQGSRSQRVALRQAISALIGRYVGAVRVDTTKPGVAFDERHQVYELEIALLKQLTWQYVIMNPALGAQQHGRAHVIEELFRIYFEAWDSEDWNHIVPPAFRARTDPDGTPVPPVRRVADIVSSFTDFEALAMYRRLTGHSADSLLPARGW